MDQPISVTIDATAIPTQVTGVGRYVFNLTAALGRRHDVEVSVITRAGDRARWAEANPGMAIHDVAPSRRPIRIAWEQARMPALLRELAPQVHHGPHYTMPRRARMAKVVTVHDMTLMDHPEWHERTKVVFFRDAIRAAIRAADVILCDSQATADRLLSFGQPVGHVMVAPLGVDLTRFSPAGADDVDDDLGAEALGRLGVRPPYLAFVGTVEPRKGVPDLVAAFNRVAGDHPDLSLVIAGLPGWGEADAAAAIAASEFRSRIVRLGFIDDADVAPLLRQAAAVVYPSLEEGFGLPVLESLACGAPTVTTTGSAMEEYATGSAVLVSPGDVDAVAGAVRALLGGDPGLAERRRKGFEVAAARSWDACATTHVAAYRKAIEDPIRRG